MIIRYTKLFRINKISGIINQFTYKYHDESPHQ